MISKPRAEPARELTGERQTGCGTGDPSRLPRSPDASDLARHYIVLHGFGAKKTLNPDVAELLPWTPTNFKAWDPAAGVERNISLAELYAAADGAYIQPELCSGP